MNTSYSLSTLLIFLFACNLYAQQWERVTELPAVQMLDIYIKGSTMFVAGPNSIYYSSDDGANWDSTATIHPDQDYIAAIELANGRLYAATAIMGVWSSADNGQTWQPDNAGLNGLGAQDMAALTVRGDSLYAATYGSGVFVKNIQTNSNWSLYNNGMPWYNIECIANIDGTLFAGSGANATFVLQSGSNHAWVEKTFAGFNGDSNAFLGVVKHGNVLLAAGNYGLYRSTDNGETWTHYNPGTGLLGMGRFAIDGARVYAQLVKPSGQAFIKYTDDGGLSWQNFQPALNGSAGIDIAYVNGYLYSARANGLWRIARTTPVSEPVAALPVLYQNYPNPFSENTTISFNLPETEKVTVAVFDLKGTLVNTLWNGTLPQGKHEIYWNSEKLPTGSYVYRITSESGTAARIAQKMAN